MTDTAANSIYPPLPDSAIDTAEKHLRDILTLAFGAKGVSFAINSAAT